jgi:serine/threonine-protein kinase
MYTPITTSDERIIAGKYRLLARLSQGGMATIWRAQHLELECQVAVKLLDRDLVRGPDAVLRFKQEAQLAAALRSTNIVQVLDYGIERHTPYMVMELLRGQSLAERIQAQCFLTPRETARILAQAAKAISWAHNAGIIHRDLKPDNIFLAEEADELVVKLLDFGIARPTHPNPGAAPITMAGTVMGTPQYMSPEQASGRAVVDHRTDIWSFGVIAFECLTGMRVFEANTLAGILLAVCVDPLPVPSAQASVPTGFDEWFTRCAHRDSDRRFNSITDAAAALSTICAPQTVAVGLSQRSVCMSEEAHSASPSRSGVKRVLAARVKTISLNATDSAAG